MIDGNQVRLTCEFRDFGGALADPASVVVTVTPRGGAPTTLTAVRDGLGAYHVDYVPPSTGRYFARWSGTGGVVASDELAFHIYPGRA